MPRPSIRPALIVEWLINLSLWLGWVVLMASGTENGIGYFHQPRHDLLIPLLNGAMFNAATFAVVGFYLVPRYLARRQIGRFLVGLGILSGAVLVLKTGIEKLIIALSMPDLADLPFSLLVLENLYVLPGAVLWGMLYRFARDWFSDQREFRQASEPDWADKDSTILVKSGTTMHRVLVEKILYIKSEGNYVIFFDTQKKVMAHMTMAEVLERLPSEDFIRIHRSYIAAVAHIDSIEANRIKVHDQHLPIGGKYREVFLQQMNLTFRQA